MQAYVVDVGILLSKNNKEFDFYSTVYDKQYGYFDENQFYIQKSEKAIDFVNKYVKEGVDNTYGVISQTTLPDDFNFEDSEFGPEKYLLEDVVYSIAKIDGKIVESFIATGKEI